MPRVNPKFNGEAFTSPLMSSHFVISLSSIWPLQLLELWSYIFLSSLEIGDSEARFIPLPQL